MLNHQIDTELKVRSVGFSEEIKASKLARVDSLVEEELTRAFHLH